MQLPKSPACGLMSNPLSANFIQYPIPSAENNNMANLQAAPEIPLREAFACPVCWEEVLLA